MIDISGLSVCYRCDNRHVGCHSKCERYLQEVETNSKEKKKLRDRKAAENYISEYAVKTREKYLRKYGHTYIKIRR